MAAGSRVSLELGLGGPNALVWRRLAPWEGSLDADLGLGLAQRRSAGSIHRLCI